MEINPKPPKIREIIYIFFLPYLFARGVIAKENKAAKTLYAAKITPVQSPASFDFLTSFLLKNYLS